MSDVRSDFDNRNPEGILNNTAARRGAQLYSELFSKTETIDFSIKGILEAKKDLDDLEKKISNVHNRASLLSGKQKEDLEAYAKRLQQRYDFEENRINRLSEHFERLNNVSLKDEKELLEIEKEVKKVEEGIDYELQKISAERLRIKKNEELSPKEKREQLKELENRERATENLKRKNRGENSIEFDEFVESLGGDKTALGLAASHMGEDAVMERLDNINNMLGGHLPQLSTITTTVKLISSGLSALRTSMTKSIENAADTMSSYYGRINANLEKSDYSWKSITADVDKALGLNRFVKQTDYLQQISDLTTAGYINDIEQRALLETIKDKTLTSFDVANAGLTRLVQLGKQNSINQFGLELQLKRLLNRKIFGDSSYLQNMFDSVTSAIIDSAVATKSDITNFNSTVQTYLGAMYASGLSDNVVSAIAQGINSLGSGNVQALAQDESIQRLFLLSMDRIGMDYADVLQQGLSSSDTSKLLASVIEYLDEIAKNTNDNLVLKSSYSNLFNLSTSDLQAIQNVSKHLSTISSSVISSSQAVQQTKEAVSTIINQNTLPSEQFDNFLANFSYSFGSNIAENNTLYTTYKINDIMYNILDQISTVGGVFGKYVNAAKVVPAAVQYAIGIKGFLPLLSELASTQEGSLITLLDSASTASSSGGSSSQFGSNALKRLKGDTAVSDKIGDLNAFKDEWSKKEDESDQQAEILKVLDEISNTLMYVKTEGDEKQYALAVSLQGMSNNVLRSFASIFADESAMQGTFEGSNNVLAEALFNYANDTTTNSSSDKSGNKSGGKSTNTTGSSKTSGKK